MSGRARAARRAGAAALLAAAALLPGPLAAQDAHALIVVGIGGEPKYTERFHEWASALHDALIERHNLAAERVTYLGERPETDPQRIKGPSRREDVEAAVGEIVRRAGPEDHVLIVIFGHGGTGQGSETVINLPGPDVGGADLAAWLAPLATQHVAVVNTTSASGPFVQALSGPRRTVITATRTAQERNETWFGRYFVAAYTGEDADLDKDGRVSLLEAFQYAVRETARHYQEQGLLLTEHALIDDDADQKGSTAPDLDAGDGRLARTFAFGRMGSGVPANVTDPVLRGLLQERAELERRLDALRARRQSMQAADYERELEALLVEVALKDREIRLRGGGR